MNIKEIIAERIASGLRRKAINCCSKWACEYRYMGQPYPGPWKFDRHPWLREMHDADSEMIVGQKAAQMGFTEWALNKTLFKIDIEGITALYILPSESDASDFSAARFDPALESSEHLRKLFSDVANVGLKRAGQASLYIRGSRSRSKLKSIPVGFIVFDELDEMPPDNIALAMERGSGQESIQVLMLSTPTIKDHGINGHYKDSTQEIFTFKCPSCNRWTDLQYPDCLVITADEITDPRIEESHLICKECKNILPNESKIEWLSTAKYIPTYPNRPTRGFTVSQLYSCAKAARPSVIARSVIKASYDPTEATELYNSKLGLTYEAPGARVTETEIDACIKQYTSGPTGRSNIRSMGVDVGTFLHYEIDEWYLPSIRTPGLEINDEARPRLLKEGKVKDFSELDKLMHEYRIGGCVIDREPESRLAYQFACRFWGAVFLCKYGKGISGKEIRIMEDDQTSVLLDRTSWLDLSLGRFRQGSIDLPMDLSNEYRKHVKEPVRVYEKDKDGNPVGRYVSAGDDHAAHSRNYAEIALRIAIKIGQSHDIQGIL
jgi:hypothetical protein